jgi:hypothetical protein
MSTARLRLLALVLPCLISAHPAPAAPPPPTLARPRTGELAPQSGAPLTVELVARSLDSNCETLQLKVREGVDGATVFVETSGPRPWSGPDASGGLVIRRSASEAGQPVRGRVFEPARTSRPGQVHSFELPSTSGMKPDDRAQKTWIKALATYLGRQHSPWHGFAARRLTETFVERASDAPARTPRRGALVATPHRNPSDLAQLMETTTGVTSIQEALQTDRRLLVAENEQATVDVSTLAGPPLAQHPWDKMLAELHADVPDEPLARVAPADFYFVRFRSFDHLMRMLDKLDAWITPAANLLSEAAEDRALAARYEAELGLGRSGLARVLGPSVIDQVAVVGSDPYLREGSDLTFIFRVKSKPAFDLAISSALASHGARHGGLQTRRMDFEGIGIEEALSPDGAIRQHRASVKDLEIVSNSPRAIRRVLANLSGRTHASALADQPDFRYMMARDRAVRADVLAFMGDAFIANVAGSRQKILEARRQLALARLSTPGYAALLYGWMFGRQPSSVAELLASRLLRPEDLRHADGEAIQWSPAHGARSSWGSPAALTPILDLESPRKVTALERDAYAEFVRGYQQYWRRYFDPAAVRIALDDKSMQVDLRVLPLIDATDYRELEKAVGRARVTPGQSSPGLRTALGIGENAEIRRETAGMLRRIGGRRLDLDWLGGWALLGMDDNAKLPGMLLNEVGDERALRQRPMRPDEEAARHRRFRESDLADLPVYGGIELRSTTAAVMFLAAARKMAEDAAPGMVDWRESGRERDIPIVTVRAAGELSAEKLGSLALHYAFCRQSFLASLNLATLRARVDECVDGRLPTSATEGNPGAAQHPQWVLDVDLAPNRPFWYMASWLLDATGRDVDKRARAVAEVVLRAAPQASAPELRNLGLRALGLVPLSFDGRELTLAPEGVRDPLRGSEHAPRWPELPVAGSPIARLLEAAGKARSEVSFDEEPRVGDQPMRGLHVRLTLAP